MQYLETISIQGRLIRTTRRHWEHIVSKHESIEGLEEYIIETLQRPEYIRKSKEDENVFLYYASYKSYYICVVTRHLNGDGFIVTAYLTDKVKKGETVYEAD